MTCRHEKRKWFICVNRETENIDYLVSAFSEAMVHKHVIPKSMKHNVVRPAWYQVALIFSRVLKVTHHIEEAVNDDFILTGDGWETQIIVLS